MKTFLLLFSAAANAALLAGIFVAVPKRAELTATTRKIKSEVVETRCVEPTNIDGALLSSPEPFHWSQVESKDFRAYGQNLRDIGCPEQTIRDILTAEIEQLFVQRRQDLLRPIQHQFWDLMAKDGDPISGEIDEKLGALKQEKHELLKQIVLNGGRGIERVPVQSEYELVLGNFIPTEKTEQLRAITKEQRKLSEEKDMSDAADLAKRNEITERLKELELQAEQLLSSEERDELKLRKSDFANHIGIIAGFDATENELRELARIKLQSKDAKQEAVDEKIKAFLGEERFEEFTRGSDSTFQELNRIGRRYQLPKGTIVHAHEIVRGSSGLIKQVEQANDVSDDVREAELAVIREQTQRALNALVGDKAADTFQRISSDWNNVTRP